MSQTPPRLGRPAGLTGRDLLSVARGVFVERGLAGASMEEVATRARISKSSLYREHPSKAALYSAVVSDWVAAGRDSMRPALDLLITTGDPRRGLIDLATTMRQGILSPEVLQMRRLITSEAASHPDVAAAYLKQSWERNIESLGGALRVLAEDGRLQLSQPMLAAEQLTWLVIGAPLNAHLLTTESVTPTSSVEDAVELFLARYGTPAKD